MAVPPAPQRRRWGRAGPGRARLGWSAGRALCPSPASRRRPPCARCPFCETPGSAPRALSAPHMGDITAAAGQWRRSAPPAATPPRPGADTPPRGEEALPRALSGSRRSSSGPARSSARASAEPPWGLRPLAPAAGRVVVQNGAGRSGAAAAPPCLAASGGRGSPRGSGRAAGGAGAPRLLRRQPQSGAEPPRRGCGRVAAGMALSAHGPLPLRGGAAPLNPRRRLGPPGACFGVWSVKNGAGGTQGRA